MIRAMNSDSRTGHDGLVGSRMRFSESLVDSSCLSSEVLEPTESVDALSVVLAEDPADRRPILSRAG